MAERIARIQLQDGRVARFAVDEKLSPQEILTHAENYFGSGATIVPTSGPESMYESMRKAGAEMGPKAIIAGAGTRIDDYAMRLKQLLGGDLTPQEQSGVIAGRQASGPAAFGRLAIDVGAGLVATPATLPGAVAAGGVQGFVTNPVLPGETGAQHASEGAIGGGIGHAGMRFLQGLVRPITPSPAVQSLAQEGIIPTPGQAARATGTRFGELVGRLEESASSIPGVGQVIQGARARAAVDELGRAALTRATPRGMTPTQHIGREGLDETYEMISGRYNEALQRIGILREDPMFQQDIVRRVNRAVLGLPRAEAERAREIIQDVIGGRETPVVGAYTAQIAKRVDEDLGARIRDFRNARNADASSRQIADAIQAAQGAWRDLIRRNAPNQETREMLDDANRAFANYIRVERATGKSAAPEGEFGPTQLKQAVRETSPGSGRKSQYARGTALMEDLSDPAARVLTGTLGESGTVPRAILAGALLGGGGAVATNQFGGDSPYSGALTGLLAAGALSPALYSRMAGRYAIGDLAPRLQGTLAEVLGIGAPYASVVGRSLYPELQR